MVQPEHQSPYNLAAMQVKMAEYADAGAAKALSASTRPETPLDFQEVSPVSLLNTSTRHKLTSCGMLVLNIMSLCLHDGAPFLAIAWRAYTQVPCTMQASNKDESQELEDEEPNGNHVRMLAHPGMDTMVEQELAFRQEVIERLQETNEVGCVCSTQA